ncbi:hydroxymethylglutaryl-CoA lyase [Agrobacterium vitis]|uniref:Hydroxymethylglutaryl-CoA lyase n=1 Tax=Agrobacterium vitis TaxID=373 RepID=A0A368NLL5_AGRVI|nr:hydroxymethylglutaryl-CoA lyase [Agrobacterium vitis]KAA3506251.1 hydroxymethylglutaryl-CoA lyase [Agrobacterium vitis]KAA3518276.1 hydroxymethylglutaryl-CoA lyase [Agrobacterium vitis]KAA3520640.1 hydroxymethylglutaryl-CoA lyase [Agrobacterium vitis]MCF1480131.1 hydroxymethylglutaryl-CoA lyase [Agrobacterium vitis]MUP07881.1 hydroxymethylglutaryl-CoA lyase [Agrobacterium vitis]
MPTRDISISDVVLRDGLQLVDTVLMPETKMQIFDMLYAAGVRSFDVTSFVPPARFPQYADAVELVAHGRSKPDVFLSAFAPNPKGAERAVAAGVDSVSFVVSASVSHNLANVRNTPTEQMEAAKAVKISMASAERPAQLVLAIAAAFGCSIEGAVDPESVFRLAEQARDIGADEICISDTVGYASPRQVKDIVAGVRSAAGADIPLRIHLHDTTGTGMACAYAALEVGITRFDAALGGLGGCPFAPGASGNISTEDLVYMMETSGQRTGIDLETLLIATHALHTFLPNDPMPSHIFTSGIPKAYGMRT